MSKTAKWVICCHLRHSGHHRHHLCGDLPGRTRSIRCRALFPARSPCTGHYHKRALISAVIGVVLLAIAVYLGMTTRRSAATQDGSTVARPAPGSTCLTGEEH